MAAIEQEIRTSAQELVEFFQLERMPRVPAEHYYDVVAQMVTRRTGNWAAFGVGFNRTFQEIVRTRARYTHSNALFAFDWWEGLPEDWRPDFPKGKFRIPREDVVRWYRYDPTVVFLDGLFSESLTAPTIERMGDLALVHFDCDLYSSTRMVLDRLPLFPGTILMFDEFYAPAGEWKWHEHEAKAFHEVCVERSLRVWPLCRKDVASATFSEQAAFLLT